MTQIQVNDIFLEVEPPMTARQLLYLAVECNAKLPPFAENESDFLVVGSKTNKRGDIINFNYREDDELDLKMFQRFFIVETGGCSVA